MDYTVWMCPPPVLLDALVRPDSSLALRALDAAGELTALIPELEAGRGFGQPERHHFDVLAHNLAAVAAADAAMGDGEDGQEFRAQFDWVDIPEALHGEVEGIPLRALIRLGCLLHDVAKPHTATHNDEGQLRFPRHGPRGGELMTIRLPQLGFGPESTGLVTRLIRYHLRPGELVRSWPPTDRAIRRFVQDIDGHVLPLVLVNLADGMATRGPAYTRQNFRRHCGILNYILARAWAASDQEEPPLVAGEDLMAELDLESGRLLGAVLTSVRRAQLEGAISGRDEALAMARMVLARLKAESGRTGPHPEGQAGESPSGRHVEHHLLHRPGGGGLLLHPSPAGAEESEGAAQGRA